MYGKRHSEEALAKMRGPRGKFSAESRARMSAAHIGLPVSASHRAALSAALRGRKFSEEWRARISDGLRGRPLSAETRAKIGAIHRGRTLGPRSPEHTAKLAGPNHWNWRGGRPQDRGGFFYIAWKRAVHKRDDNTCQMCGAAGLAGLNRQADHIASWRDFPELRYDVANGRTLCKPCHIKHSGPQVREMIRRTRLSGNAPQRAAKRIGMQSA